MGPENVTVTREDSNGDFSTLKVTWQVCFDLYFHEK